MFEQEKRSLLVTVSVLTVLLTVPSFADSDPSAAENALDADVEATMGADLESESETAAAASLQTASDDSGAGPLSKLQIHGFLTQAVAAANFTEPEVGPLPPPPLGPGGIGPLGSSPSFLELSLGIPEDTTTNYRSLALQFRYEISPKDIFVVQFSSRSLGFSPLQEFEDEIELDWAFYERRLGDQTSLKVGRVQIPLGIYNEVRDVGTVLPFYRPAFVFYKEGSFTSETVDGLSLTHTFGAASDWSLDATVYFGEWESIQIFPFAPEDSGIIRAEDGYGGQLWLNTPLSDLRLGVGTFSFKQEGGPFVFPDRRQEYHYSLDATLSRFTVQAEWTREEAAIILPFGRETATDSSWYILAGVRASDKLRLWAQLENNDIKDECNCFVNGSVSRTQREDFGVALNYFFTPTLVLKGEYHWVDEAGINLFPDFSTGAFLFRPEVFTSTGGSYSILALSVSF